MTDDAPSPAHARPELLAPAGDATCLRAAVENGADAVYFGLTAHNARARAANFDVGSLPDTMRYLHRHGVKGYVTFNTLIFPRELEGAERLLRQIAAAGVDAVIVQDLGLCRLIRAVAPDLAIHASTQMTISSAGGVRLAEELGASRVILARELSLEEIGRLRRETSMPLEVFVHGALCVAYSGQCLTSEALGARSANRGECAQACRMPYTIVCDGRDIDLKEVEYLLSPQDLAAIDLIPRLVELGVASLKIEGRLKSPEYVASVTRHYREAIDRAVDGRGPFSVSGEVMDEMAMTFSRGFSHGFLDGNNHKALVRGDYAKKRGLFLGRVAAVRGSRVRVRLESSVKPGDGVVFDEDAERGLPEQGGRVYAAHPAGSGGLADLEFGRRDVETARLAPGQRLWKTDDPELTARIRRTFDGPTRRTVGIELSVRAVAGEPLVLEGRTAGGHRARVESDAPLAPATNRPASEEELRTQCDRLGGTAFHLAGFSARIEGGPMVPRSVLNGLRRELVERLASLAEMPPPTRLAAEAVLARLRAGIAEASAGSEPHGDDGSRTRPDHADRSPGVAALCRDDGQAVAAVEAGVRTLYLDYQHIKLYRQAVEALKPLADDLRIYLAPPRIEKPGESGFFRLLAKQGADGFLARNAGSLEFCLTHGIPFVTDYSLNAANELTVDLLRRKGATRVTASYDLSFDQLDDLAAAVDPAWLEVVIHQHMPMFHMEHCVFCAFLSPGTDKTNCGRPCDVHDVKLRDRVGMEHPLKADIGCRNTLHNAVAQSAAEYLPRLLKRGVRSFRVEFLDESAETVGATVALYAEAIEGRRDPRSLWRELRATSRYGITRGQLAIVE
jgi:putative protease